MMRPDGHVMVGEKDRDKFGIDEVGVDGVEIYGRRAVPVGFVPDIHLFTTAGFVLTSLDNSRSFLRLPASHATYLVAKCCPGTDIEKVAAELQQVIPEHDVLTSQTFHDMTAHYWATRTGIGPVLLMSSGLAVSVGFLIVMLAFYISTIEKIPIFACMKALGASDWEVVKILIFQSVIVFVVGSVIAGVGLYVAVIVISQTTISVVITTNVVLTGLGTTALVSAASSLLSVRRVLTTDPGEAFRS